MINLANLLWVVIFLIAISCFNQSWWSSIGAMTALSLGTNYLQRADSLFLESDIISMFGP